MFLLTDTEFKICLAVRRYHTLGRILTATSYKSFDDLQDQFSYNGLDFDDFDATPETVIYLTHRAEEEFHKRKNQLLSHLLTAIGIVVALLGIIVSIVK